MRIKDPLENSREITNYGMESLEQLFWQTCKAFYSSSWEEIMYFKMVIQPPLVKTNSFR